MKLHLTRIATVVAATVMLSACTKTNVEGPGGPGGDDDLVAAVINAGIGGSSANTRVHDAEWDEGDAIGLAMLTDGGAEVINDVYNYHYITSEHRGVFEPQTGEMMIYFPADGSLVTFRSYYPFYKDLGTDMNIPVDVSNQNRLPDIDLMSAEHISGFSKSDPMVRLYFHHRLSKLIFRLSTDNDNDFPPLEDATLTIKGMKTTGTYHLLQESLAVDDASGKTITFPAREDGSERYGIVLPRAAGAGVEFDFTFPDGSTYNAKMSENLELLGGYQYTFYINLKETGVTVSADIAEWIEAPARYYDSVQASVDAGESVNVEDGTVMDVFISEDNQDYSELTPFKYKGTDGKWYPETDVYWESIPYTPAYMRSSIVMDDPLNGTQTGDWLTSGVETVARNTGANFTLSRAVSKVFVTLRSDLHTEDQLNSAKITLPDYFTGGYLRDGEFIPGTGRADILLVPEAGTTTRDAASGTSVALFQPQSVSAGGTLVSISIDGRTYDVEAPAGGFTYEAGVAERFILTVKEEGVTVSVTIVDWELGDLIDFDAVQVATVAGPSHNVEEGDKIDLYMIEGTSWNYFSSYVYNADGSWYGSPVKYWENIPSDPAYFIARMDAAGALNDTQLPDVLLSEATAGYSNTGVDLVLEHAATKVIVGLSSDTFTDEQSAAATITLPGYTVGGRFDGAKLVPGTATGDIVVARTDDISGVAVFEPQAIPEGQTAVRITYGSTVFEAPAPEGGLEFPEGVATTMIVRFEKGEISIGVKVTDWIDDTVELKAQQVIVEAGSTSGVLEGETLEVFAGATREPLNTYKYENSKWISATPVYWEDIGLQQTFYGAILREQAYNATMPDDYLLSGPVTVQNPNAVNFPLSHAVARVAIRLISSNNTVSATELANMEVMLPNYEGLGYYDNGEFIPGTGLIDVEIAKVNGENGISGLAFIQEQTIEAGKTVAVVYDETRGVEYRVAASSDIFFEAGYNTILEIDIRDTAVLISAQVTDWTEAPTVRMVPDAIPITGDLDANSAFFEGKTIYLYNMGENTERYDYSYKNGVWSGDENLYWDHYYNTGLDLTAVYYPYSDYIPADLAGQTSFTWNLPDDQSNGWDRRDLLMDNQSLAAGVHSYFNFKFHHILSRVRVNLTSSEFTDTDLAGATVTLNNFIITGSADLTDATAVPTATREASLIPYTEQDGREYSALVMPQKIDEDITVVTIKLRGYPDREFYGVLEDPLTFTAGYITTINVDLKLTRIELSATLEEWKENGSGGITIQ